MINEVQMYTHTSQAKQKYRGMFETQKVRKQEKFRRDWFRH